MADGSCVASQGGTSVLVTAVSPESSPSNENNNASFVPLIVDYRCVRTRKLNWFTNYIKELGVLCYFSLLEADSAPALKTKKE